MGIRPRTKLVLRRKSRRCPKCNKAVNNQSKRCKRCAFAQPKVSK